jgi:hypothetical protein
LWHHEDYNCMPIYFWLGHAFGEGLHIHLSVQHLTLRRSSTFMDIINRWSSKTHIEYTQEFWTNLNAFKCLHQKSKKWLKTWIEALDVDKASQMIWYSTYFKGFTSLLCNLILFHSSAICFKYEVKEYK